MEMGKKMNKIMKLGMPILRLESKRVVKITEKEKRIVKKMWEVLDNNKTGVGISAPQVGFDSRIISVKNDDGNRLTIVNPILVEVGTETEEMMEGCLSIPNVNVPVSRRTKIKVKGTKLNGEEIEIEANGFLARKILHEIDHLNGILIIDHLPNFRRRSILEMFKLKDKNVEWTLLKAKEKNLIS